MSNARKRYEQLQGFRRLRKDKKQWNNTTSGRTAKKLK